MTCSSGGACEEYDNRSTGQAFEGESNHGTGIYGYSGDTGIGVNGDSVSGYGVEGTGGKAGGYFTGSDEGLLVDGIDAYGIWSTAPVSILAVSDSENDPVIEAYSGGNDIFEGFNPSDVAALTVDKSGNVVDNSEESQGTVQGGSNDNSAYGAILNGEDYGALGSNQASDDCHCGIGDAVYADGYGGDLFVGNNSDSNDVFTVDNSGNVDISGVIKTAGSCSSGCVSKPSEPGVHIVKYAPTVSEPMTEDFGEGQMTNGSGYVRLDATFAKTIDQSTNYMVFITPEGNSNGVYVTQKSASGFAVRENNGGHSTLAFSWRIVAKPYGSTDARLPVVDIAADTVAKHIALVRPKLVHKPRPQR
ncbi:MAG TPA: hypothetical protein VEJ20_01195 [Candidatus Eremiobacteraceae bacterium]|nr:hypothetical protein [Candidatus Eremiobacteraceae bacterium]